MLFCQPRVLMCSVCGVCLSLDWKQSGQREAVVQTYLQEKRKGDRRGFLYLQPYRCVVESPIFFTLYLSPLWWQTPYTDWETLPRSCIFIYLLAACIEFLSSRDPRSHSTRWFRFFCTALEKQCRVTVKLVISHWDSLRVMKPEIADSMPLCIWNFSHKSSLVYVWGKYANSIINPNNALCVHIAQWQLLPL